MKRLHQRFSPDSRQGSEAFVQGSEAFVLESCSCSLQPSGMAPELANPGGGASLTGPSGRDLSSLPSSVLLRRWQVCAVICEAPRTSKDLRGAQTAYHKGGTFVISTSITVDGVHTVVIRGGEFRVD